MEIKRWKKNSSHVAIVLDRDEFSLFRTALMKSKKDHWPGDGTCNGHSYKVVNEICRMSFEEWMESPDMVSPGYGDSEKITVNLNGHDYTDFQDSLKIWKEEWNKSENIVEIAIAETIVNAGWGRLMEGEKVVFEV
jgi:hypothetical protein